MVWSLRERPDPLWKDQSALNGTGFLMKTLLFIYRVEYVGNSQWKFGMIDWAALSVALSFEHSLDLNLKGKYNRTVVEWSYTTKAFFEFRVFKVLWTNYTEWFVSLYICLLLKDILHYSFIETSFFREKQTIRLASINRQNVFQQYILNLDKHGIDRSLQVVFMDKLTID